MFITSANAGFNILVFDAKFFVHFHKNFLNRIPYKPLPAV